MGGLGALASEIDGRVAFVEMEGLSFVPDGTWLFALVPPSAEALGYCLSSLWDYGL